MDPTTPPDSTPMPHAGTPDPVKATAVPCGLLRRLLVILYDALGVVAVLMVTTALALPVTRGQVVALQDPGFTAYLVAVVFMYLALFWRRGQTLGMRAWRVHLRTQDGQPLSWPRCALRFIVALLAAAAALLGFLWALTDAQRRTWHDRASRSRLVVTPRQT
jgi:uncharacterized RDD family membrane protein YckC